VTPEDARNTIEQWLTTLSNVEIVEVSFYGGSFTGIPVSEQTAFLKIAKEYKDSGRINAIHLSTRPDYISEEILDNLKYYGVDVIELGVQSFDENVLKLSGRGHNTDCVYKACDLIRHYGFTLGIQLMTGLPGDTMETCIYSAREAVKIKPEIARIYPTVTIHNTELYEMMERGEYRPLSLEEAVSRTKAIYEILDDASINVIRIGLKSSEIMDDELGFHPAFRQLVETEMAKERIISRINAIIPEAKGQIWVFANSHSYGNIFGHKGSNREFFKKNYPGLEIRGGIDNSLKDNQYEVSLL